MSPGGAEEDVPQHERARIMREQARSPAVDLEKHIPGLADGRQPPQLSDERKEQIRQELAAAEAKARASTYHAFTAAEIDMPRDRFHQVTKASIVGQSAGWPKMPEGNPWSGPPDLHNIGRTDEEIARDEARRIPISGFDPNPASQGMKARASLDPGGAVAPSLSASDVEPAPPSSPKGANK